MHNTRKINDSLVWVGANDRRLAMFEGVYSVPDGVSYNSYILKDEKTVLFDTVDKAVGRVFFENLEYELNGRTLDYVVVHHMEPDHSATLAELVLRYPNVTVVCSAMASNMINQFYGADSFKNRLIVTDDSILETGHHKLRFFTAPMVHWPEVIVTYDETDRVLFSADAFGSFGALNGALFADEVDFMRDYLDEARRYYANIVGKYGPQVQSLLKKVASVKVDMICPLHGFVWRRDIESYIDKYQKWSTYTPEEYGVMLAYASIYGNTENAAEILSRKLFERGVKVEMYDVSVKPASDIVSAAFRYSHLVFASSTYNAGVFVTMDALLRDIEAHALKNRTVAFIENGSWAPQSGKLMREILAPLNFRVINETVRIKSALADDQEKELDALADAIAATIPETAKKKTASAPTAAGEVQGNALFNISYGLFVLSAKDSAGRDCGCIINTLEQITATPIRVSIAVNKDNYTHEAIMATGEFTVSVLTESTPFSVFENFGFCSSRDKDKFAGYDNAPRGANGIAYVPEHTNAFISGKVISVVDCGTHSIFIADVTEAKVLSDEPALTYTYYYDNIKPKKANAAPTAPNAPKRKVWVCKICGYVYEGEELPPDFVCPICKHPASDFELREI